MVKEEVRYPFQERISAGDRGDPIEEGLFYSCDDCGKENTVIRLVKRTYCEGCGKEYFTVFHVYYIHQGTE